MNPIHTDMKKAFDTWFETNKGIKYNWADKGKSTKAVNLLYDRLVQTCTDKNMKPDNATVLMLFEHLLAGVVSLKNDWYMNNVDLCFLNSQYNRITGQLMQRKEQSSYSGMKEKIIRNLIKNEQRGS